MAWLQEHSTKEHLRTHVRHHGDNFYSQWHSATLGVENPLHWMRDTMRLHEGQTHPRGAQKRRWWSCAPRVRRERLERPKRYLACLQADQRHWSSTLARSSEKATQHVLGHRGLAKFLATIPSSGVAFVVINGPECLSTKRTDRSIFYAEA